MIPAEGLWTNTVVTWCYEKLCDITFWQISLKSVSISIRYNTKQWFTPWHISYLIDMTINWLVHFTIVHTTPSPMSSCIFVQTLEKGTLIRFFFKGDKKCINFFFLRTKFKLLLNDGFIFKMVFFTRSLTILWENNVNSMSNTDNFPVKNKISDDYICRLFSWIFG